MPVACTWKYHRPDSNAGSGNTALPPRKSASRPPPTPPFPSNNPPTTLTPPRRSPEGRPAGRVTPPAASCSRALTRPNAGRSSGLNFSWRKPTPSKKSLASCMPPRPAGGASSTGNVGLNGWKRTCSPGSVLFPYPRSPPPCCSTRCAKLKSAGPGKRHTHCGRRLARCSAMGWPPPLRAQSRSRPSRRAAAAEHQAHGRHPGARTGRRTDAGHPRLFRPASHTRRPAPVRPALPAPRQHAGHAMERAGLQAGGERNLWAHQGNKDRSDHTGNRSHRLQGADRPSQRHQRETATGPEAGHAASGLRRGAGARCLLRGAGVRAMNGMSNAKEALIAEVLGDMASLIERIEKLGPDMEVSRRELLKASNHLAFQMSGFEGRIAKLSENAVDLCVSQINQKASGVCANTQNTQIAAMQSAAREMFNKEFLPVVNRVVSQLEQLARLFQPDRNPWLPWLTHGGAFVTGAALTWLVVVMIWVR